jgi:hypothetical protein
MIDASQFSTTYNAFWNEIAPAMEHFVRKLNRLRLRRAYPPLPPSLTKNRGVVAEYAFALFAERAQDEQTGISRSVAEIKAAAWYATLLRIKPILKDRTVAPDELDRMELEEVVELASRLTGIFLDPEQPAFVKVRPMFNGCGYVDASEGDLISEGVLYEVKTVDRLFRGIDIRQVITYAALNFSSRQHEITALGLVNPRTGHIVRMSIEEVSVEIAGKRSEELFFEIIHAISSGDISR